MEKKEMADSHPDSCLLIFKKSYAQLRDSVLFGLDRTMSHFLKVRHD